MTSKQEKSLIKVLAPLLICERDAAAILNLNVSTLVNLRRHGMLVFVQFGRRVLYRPTDLGTFIEWRKKDPSFNGKLKGLSEIPIGRSGKKTITALSGIANVRRLWGAGKRITAVYFLIEQREVVYVGQSRNVYSRVAVHMKEKIIKFSTAWCLVCNEDELTPLENRYIAHFRPKYNRLKSWMTEDGEARDD